MTASKRGGTPVQNNTKSCNPPDLKNASRYRLQDASAQLLRKEFRVSACCRAVIKTETSVNVVQHPSGKLSYSNVQKCGSVWVCPVCSAKIASERRTELATLIDAAVNAGAAVAMVTLTVPHGIGDELSVVLAAMSKAKRLMQNRKPWKRWAADHGLIGEVRALECTYGANGFHPHFHILLFFRKQTAVIPAHVLKMWQDACVTAGLKIPSDKGFDYRTAKKSISDYVCKFGMDYELTYGNQTKTARKDGRVPFQLLADYYDKKDLQAGAAFRIYAKAFKGKRQLVYSKGLKALFGLAPEKTDEEIMSDETDTKVVYSLTRKKWQALCKQRKRGAFLDWLTVVFSGADALTLLDTIFDPLGG